MARYCDLSSSGSGHAGTELDPWSWADLVSNTLPYFVDTFGDLFIKGSVDTTDNLLWAFDEGSISYEIKNWVEGEIWRINTTGTVSISDYVKKCTMKNGLIRSTNSANYSISIFNCLNMILLSPNGKLYTNGNEPRFTYKGCTIQTDVVTWPDENFDLQDSVVFGGNITLTSLLSFTPAFVNCVFEGDFINDQGTLTDCQTEWSAPSLPAWDADKSAWHSDILSVGINTPPQPGNSPYSGYNTGPWGESRTGIGAFNFEVTGDENYTEKASSGIMVDADSVRIGDDDSHFAYPEKDVFLQ
jgi:hypothetical protein